jgi:iron complex outermembrane receptor protein
MKAIKSLALSASILCLSTTIAGAALAQTATAPQAAADASADTGGIADIIVTANRRAERLQDVPISVTAVTGAQVQARGVVTTQTLPALAPSLAITHNGIAANFFLRGVGLFGGNANNESSVALYVDGVYQAAPQGNLFSLTNIERIEVLKGPQGTLFGRNATAGVIQIITKTPTHTPTFEASAGFASYNTVSGSVYASGGLTDTLAVDIDAEGSKQYHGWGRNLTNGDPTFKRWDYLIRGKALWEPTDTLKVTISGDYNRQHNPGVSPQPAPGSANVTGQGFPGRYNLLGETTDYGNVKSRGITARVDYDGGAVHLVSISAYRKDNNFFLLDQDASPAPAIVAGITGREREITQEFQATNGPDSKLVWLIGAYIFNYHTAYDRLKLGGSLGGIDFFAAQNSKSLAAFAQATYPITDTTHVTGGIRYTTEDQVYKGTVFAGNTNFVIFGPTTSRQSFTVPTWRISIDQKITPDILAYVSYNRGFKSGGYSLVVVPGTVPPFKPEKLDAYEVGIKSTLLDRHLQLNVSGFYYDYSNIQIQKTDLGQAFLYNGPKAKIYGGEVEAQYRATEALTLFANASYLHARYGDFPNVAREDRIPASGVIPAQCVGAGTMGTPNGNCAVLGINGKGNKLIFAPDWTYTLGANYSIPTSIGKFDVNASVYYYGGSYASPDNRLRNPKYYLLNGSIGWSSDDGRYGVTVFGRNLANEYYYESAYEQNFGDTITPQEPRTFGIRFNVKY